VIIALVGLLTGYAAVVCAAGALAIPAIVDIACVITGPLERHLADKYVKRASGRLRRVKPTVVAITGSYGKTSTKGYVAHLLSGSKTVVASPASFNNRAGLARAVNEHLAEGTDVFVAEMGTYGPGEIAELCSWMTPDISVITAIGPVHLERFKTEERIVEAKSEILEGSPACVILVDDPRLAVLADKCDSEGKRVWRVSGRVASIDVEPGDDDEESPTSVARSTTIEDVASGRVADVLVVARPGGLEVRVKEELLAGDVSVAAPPGNVACAVAVALDLGVSADEVAGRLASLPVAPHRLERQLAAGGFTVLDDTYNANPAGARAALSALDESSSPEGRRVLVTPGMVELGPRQASENESLAADAALVVTDFVVVGRTNRRSLVRGFRRAGRTGVKDPVLVERREEAVAWVRDQLGPRDTVLYENDLPDHYP